MPWPSATCVVQVLKDDEKRAMYDQVSTWHDVAKRCLCALPSMAMASNQCPPRTLLSLYRLLPPRSPGPQSLEVVPLQVVAAVATSDTLLCGCPCPCSPDPQVGPDAFEQADGAGGFPGGGFPGGGPGFGGFPFGEGAPFSDVSSSGSLGLVHGR